MTTCLMISKQVEAPGPSQEYKVFDTTADRQYTIDVFTAGKGAKYSEIFDMSHVIFGWFTVGKFGKEAFKPAQSLRFKALHDADSCN
jgi:hypothetical protein